MVGGEEDTEAVPAAADQNPDYPAADSPARQRKINGPLNPRYNFDLFVVGAGNQFAQAASYAVATDPAKSYNPLFLYGGVGLGKTHLLHAIGNLAFERNRRLKICYITAEKFTNELIYSLRTNQMSNFKEKYRNVDMLLVDDVQFIAGKPRTQEDSSTPTPFSRGSWFWKVLRDPTLEDPVAVRVGAGGGHTGARHGNPGRDPQP